MIEAGAGEEIEFALRQLITKDWNETSLVLYGCVRLPEPEKQLAQAEGWLAAHRRDALLLRVLGKLALRSQNFDKAKGYLEESLAAEPSVEAYQLMGDLLFQQNDSHTACQYFRNGLLFASNEVVAQIEQSTASEPVAVAFEDSEAARQ
jgi:HemY protein